MDQVQAMGDQGASGLRGQDVQRLREVWRLMIGLEEDVLREFDLGLEASKQQQGAVLIEALMGGDWLAAWQRAQLTTATSQVGWGMQLQAQAARGQALAHLANVRVRVPEVLTDYCGPGVLTMEFAGGRSLREVLESAAGGNDTDA